MDGFWRSFSHVFPSNRPFQWAAGDGADGSVAQASVLDPLHVPWIPGIPLDNWMGFFDILLGCFLMVFGWLFGWPWMPWWELPFSNAGTAIGTAIGTVR